MATDDDAGRTWMYPEHCICDEYLIGLKKFIAPTEVDMLTNGKSAMWCPCQDCKNKLQFENSTHVHAHLIIRGFMDGYQCWNKHGEEGINTEIDIHDNHRSCNSEGLFGPHANAACQDLSDTDILEMGEKLGQMPNNLEKMVRDAMSEASSPEEIARLEALMKDTKLQVYPNCSRDNNKFLFVGYAPLMLFMLNFLQVPPTTQ